MIDSRESNLSRITISPTPEIHVIRFNSVSSPTLHTRMNQKGKQFVSVFEDSPRLEWKISGVHASNSEFIGSQILTSNFPTVSVTLLLCVPEGVPLYGKMVEEVCDSFLSKEPNSNRRIQLSAAHVFSEYGKQLDLLSNESLTPSQSLSVLEISSLVQYQKFMRRISKLTHNHQGGYLVVQALLGADHSLSRRTLIISQVTLPVVSRLSLISNSRSLMKRGNLKHNDDDYLGPLLNNGTHLLMAVIEPPPDQPGLEIYERLFDALERMSLTALPAVTQLSSLKKPDYLSVDSLPGIDSHDPCLIDQSPTTSPGIVTPNSNTNCSDTTDYEIEITDLKSKNLALRHELDKYKLGCGGAGTTNSSAYSAHLVNEVKRLRAEMEVMETEKRKYATSRRLVDSLIEKSNKLTMEIESRNDKIDRLINQEKLLKLELGKMRDHCEYLLQQNRELELGYTQRDSVGVRPHSCSSDQPGTQRIDSLYKQFLFPFRGRLELELKFKKLAEIVTKMGSPQNNVDKTNKLIEDIRVRVLDLINASEKLEISAYCLIKS